MLAIFSIGSLAGGLSFGHIPIGRWAMARRLAIVAVGLTLTMFSLNIFWIGGTLFLAGIGIAPALAVLFAMTSASVKFSETAEAYGWIGTGQLIGAAAGSAIAGFLIDGVGPQGAYWAAAAFADRRHDRRRRLRARRSPTCATATRARSPTPSRSARSPDMNGHRRAHSGRIARQRSNGSMTDDKRWIDQNGDVIDEDHRGLVYDVQTLINRRRALGIFGGLTLTSLLAACGVTADGCRRLALRDGDGDRHPDTDPVRERDGGGIRTRLRGARRDRRAVPGRRVERRQRAR